MFNLPASRLRHAMFVAMACSTHLSAEVPNIYDPHHLRSRGRSRRYGKPEARHRLIKIAQRRRNAGRIKAAKKIEKHLASLQARELTTWRSW